MRWLARRYGWVVLPRADRWHKRPTALHGGVGFYIPFLAGAVWSLAQQSGVDEWQWSRITTLPDTVLLAAAALAGSLLMFGSGLWDDVKPLRPATKLIYQICAASLFVYMGGVFPLTRIQVFDLLVTYLWFVGVTNAINMLDNMDGLASGVVIIAGTTLVCLALPAHLRAPGGVLTVPLGVALVAALLGFWLHNRPPAAIFMGDSGSLSIGYTLAALAIPSTLNGFMDIEMGGNVLGPILALLIPATVVAIPIFDTTLVTITRMWRAQKASQGGRDHSSHRLVGLGLSEQKAVWVLYALAAFGGTVAVLMQHVPEQALLLFGLFGLMLVLTGIHLGHVKVQSLDRHRPLPAWTPLVTTILYKRHAAEVLLDTVLIVMCFYSAYLLRFEGLLPPPTGQVVIHSLPLVVASCLSAYFCAGIYRGQWRLIAVADLPRYGAAVIGGTALSWIVGTFVARFDAGHSHSAYVIFGFLLLLAVIGSRLSFRLLDALLFRQRIAPSSHGQPVLIYGAGQAGKLLYDEVQRNLQMQGYVVVGFIDDNPNKVGRKLCGVPIRQGLVWVRQSWSRAPEIWISSRFISDQRAKEIASHWPKEIMIRRLHLQVTPIFTYAVPSNP